MAPADRERLRQALLLGFVIVSVVLIGLIWAEGLFSDGQATPSYYRDTYEVDESIYLTVTAEAIEFQQQLSRTPSPGDQTPEHRGSGHGGGQGQGQGAGGGNQ
jgi:hypothetical protein